MMKFDEESKCLNLLGETIVYPNPSKGLIKLEIKLDEVLNDIVLTTIDLFGREIDDFNYNFDEGINIIDLDLSNYPVGIYFLNAKHEGEIHATFKLTIINE